MRNDRCLNPRQFKRAEVEAKATQIAALMRQHKARAAYLFGSVVQDESNVMSDLDIAVLPPPALDDWVDYYGAVYSDLCKLFHADNIDVVLLDRAPLALQASVVREGRQMLGSPDAVIFEDNVRARYADLVDWRKENWSALRLIAYHGFAKEIHMIDQSRVDRFTEIVRINLEKLQALNINAMPFDSYFNNTCIRDLSEHYLRLAIEAILDLGRHVLVKSRQGVPDDYRDVGKMLSERKIVPYTLGVKLEQMDGMRNVLVHLYWDINYEKIYQVVTTELGIFEQTLIHIHQFIEGRGKTS